MQALQIFLSVYLGTVLVLAEINTNRANDWERIPDSTTKCKNTLRNMTLADQLNEKLTKSKCGLDNLHCKAVFRNLFVNSALFQLQAVDENENTIVVEVYCFEDAGKPTFGLGKNTSFIAFVSWSPDKDITKEEFETVTFFENINKIGAADPSFFEFYYSLGSLNYAKVSLILASLGAIGLSKNRL